MCLVVVFVGKHMDELTANFNDPLQACCSRMQSISFWQSQITVLKTPAHQPVLQCGAVALHKADPTCHHHYMVALGFLVVCGRMVLNKRSNFVWCFVM